MPQTGTADSPYSLQKNISGSLAVKSSVSSTHILTVVPDVFHPAPEESFRLLAQERNTGNILYFNTSCPAPGQISADLSPLLGQAEYKREKDYRFYLEQQTWIETRVLSLTEYKKNTTTRNSHSNLADGIWFLDDEDDEEEDDE